MEKIYVNIASMPSRLKYLRKYLPNILNITFSFEEIEKICLTYDDDIDDNTFASIKEEFETLINNLRDKLDETTVALVSEEILATISAYNNGFDEYEKSVKEIEKLKGEKEELLKVNGKLYQRIGFDKEEKEDDKIEDDDEKEEIKILHHFRFCNRFI